MKDMISELFDKARKSSDSLRAVSRVPLSSSSYVELSRHAHDIRAPVEMLLYTHLLTFKIDQVYRDGKVDSMGARYAELTIRDHVFGVMRSELIKAAYAAHVGDCETALKHINNALASCEGRYDEKRS